MKLILPHTFRTLFLFVAFVLLTTFPSLFAASFQGVGDLPGNDYYSDAVDVSADGTVVAGKSKSTASTSWNEAYRWTASGGMVGLGDLPGGQFAGGANAISADGTSVVGQSASALGGSGEAYRWTQGSGMIGLGSLTGSSYWGSSRDVSADGSIVVGWNSTESGTRAFRWTSSQGMVALGDMPDGNPTIQAYGISDDGSVIVGYSSYQFQYQAFRWTQAGGLTGLGDLEGGEFRSMAYGLSSDGSMVVGQSLSGAGYEAFLWTETDGMTGLGDLPGGNALFSSTANDVSIKGPIVVGQGSTDAGTRPFVWDPGHGMRNLMDVLQTDLGLDLTGWILTRANAVTPDGSVIVGDGTNPDGNSEGWIAQISLLSLESPNGSQALPADSNYIITWTTIGDVNDVRLEYSTNEGSNWTTIDTVPNTDSYLWHVPNLDSHQCLAKISDANNPNVNDTSNDVFTIYTGDCVLLSPNGGEVIPADSNSMITWSTKVGIADVLLEYSTDNGTDWTIIDTVTNSGSYSWQVPHDSSTQCLVRVSDPGDPNKNDVSDSVFSVYRNITLLAPNGSEVFPSGTSSDVTWTADAEITNILLEYSINNGSDWTAIDTVPNTGDYSWTIPPVDSRQCLLRISDSENPSSVDWSDNVFTLYSTDCIVLFPNGSETFLAAGDYDIQWAARSMIANVKLEYSANNGIDWEVVALQLNSEPVGTTNWHLPMTNSSEYLVRVSNFSDSGVFDISDAPFTVTSFIGLGDLPGGNISSSALDISADGKVVVGSTSSSLSGVSSEAFRWTSSSGMVGIGDLSGGSFSSQATGISADGLVIVGQGQSASGNEAFRWIEAEGMTGLGDLPGGTFMSRAFDVSADGSVIVGYGRSDSGLEAFRWTESGGMVGLGDLPGGSFLSEAFGVSADGTVVTGSSVGIFDERELIRWTQAEGMVSLGDLPGGIFRSVGRGVSPDGSFIVGVGNSDSGYYVPLVWSLTSGMTDPGQLPGGGIYNNGYAEGVSSGGAVVVGRDGTDQGTQAFIWDAEYGMRNLKEVLQADFGLDLTGWTLSNAVAVTPDGSTIVGSGSNPSGYSEAWLAKISDPAETDPVLFEGDSTLMGMSIDSAVVNPSDFTIKTTGSEYSYQNGQLQLGQGLDPNSRRLVATLDIPGDPNFTMAVNTADHILLQSDALNIGIYGDSTCILAPKQTLQLTATGNFLPSYEGQFLGELYLADPNGGVCLYPQRYESGYEVTSMNLGQSDWSVTYTLHANQRVMLSIFPCRPPDATYADSEVIATTGSYGDPQTYGQLAPAGVIANWSQHADMVHLWHAGVYEPYDGAYTRACGPYIPYDPNELTRFIADCHTNGMKVLVYTCLFDYYRLRGRAFEPFYQEVKYLKDNFAFDGIYLDGLAFDAGQYRIDNKLANWEMIRRIRQLFGADGILYLHDSSLSTPTSTVPGIDAYCDFTLNGEGMYWESYLDPKVQYLVRKEGISNSIAYWKWGSCPSTFPCPDDGREWWKWAVDQALALGAKYRWQCPYIPSGSFWPDQIGGAFGYYVQQQSAQQVPMMMRLPDMSLTSEGDPYTETVTVGTYDTGLSEIFIEEWQFDPNTSSDFTELPFIRAPLGAVRQYVYGGNSYTVTYTEETLLGIPCLKEYESPAPNKPSVTRWMGRDTYGSPWLFKKTVNQAVVFEATTLREVVHFKDYPDMLLRLRTGAYQRGTQVADAFNDNRQVLHVFPSLPQYPNYEYVLVQWTDGIESHWEYYHNTIGLVLDVRDGSPQPNPEGDGWHLAGFYDIPLDFNRDGKIDFEDFLTFASQWLDTTGISVCDIVPGYDGDGIVNLEDYVPFTRQYGITGP